MSGALRPVAGDGAALPALGLLLVLLVSTLGEGGAQPASLALWHGLVVLLLLGALLSAARRPGGPLGIAPAPLLGFALFLAVVLVEAAFAPYAFAAWLVLLELGAFLAVAWLAARCAGALSRLATVPLGLAAGVQVAVMLWQRARAGDSRPAGTFLNENHLAAWLVAVLLLGLGQAIISRGMRARLGAGISAVAGLGLALADSRGALLGLGAGGAALAVMGWPRLAARRPRAGLAILALLVLVAGGTIARRLADADPFRYHRLKIWKASAALLIQSPWVGTGPGQLTAATANFRFPDGVEPFRYDRSFSSPHSDLLRLFCEFGGLGGLAFFASLALTLRELLSRRRRGEMPPGAEGLLAALVGLSAHALVDDLTERPAVYLLAAALAGSALSRVGPTRSGLRLAPRLALALLLAVGFLTADLAPYLSWRALAAARRAPSAADGRWLARALRFNPLQPHAWLLESERIAGDRPAWDLERYAAAREAAEHALRLQPADARFQLGLARIEAQACRTLFGDQGTRERARAAFERAQDLSRFDPLIALELGQFLIDTGDPAGARRAAERALALEPEAALPRLLLADALLAVGEPQAAEQAARLLTEAQDKATRWAGAQQESPYASQLLRLDPRLVERIERKTQAALAAVAMSGPGLAEGPMQARR